MLLRNLQSCTAWEFEWFYVHQHTISTQLSAVLQAIHCESGNAGIWISLFNLIDYSCMMLFWKATEVRRQCNELANHLPQSPVTLDNLYPVQCHFQFVVCTCWKCEGVHKVMCVPKSFPLLSRERVWDMPIEQFVLSFTQSWVRKNFEMLTNFFTRSP